MAKRRQTTGLPKRTGSSASPDEATSARQHKSRAEREAEIQRYVLIGTGAAVAVIVLILLVAVVIELVINPNRTVIAVNDETVNVAEFEERVRLERAILNTRINNFAATLSAQGLDINQFAGQEPLRTWLSQVQLPDQLGNTVVETMIEDILVRQTAEEMGITVSQEDIEQQITDFLGYDLTPPEDEAGAESTAEPTVEPTITPTPFVSPTPSPVPSPTNTPEPIEATEEATAEATDAVDTTATPTFTPVPPTSTPTFEELREQRDETRDLVFQSLTSSARISEARLTQYFETLALREAVKNAVSELTNEVPHASARHILVNTQEEAEDIVAALEAGESFSELAQAVSIDTGSGANGGELGWSPVTNFVAPFADALTEAEVGATVGPVETEFGWHVIQLHGREMREVTDDQLDAARQSEFNSWLEDQRAQNEENIDISNIWTENIPDEPRFFLTTG